MNTDTPAAAAPPPAPSNRETIVARLARSVVAIGLTLALIVIAAIAAFGLMSAARAALESTSSATNSAGTIVIGVTLLGVVLLPLVIVVVAARRGWLRWRVLAAGWLVVLPVFGWLSSDEVAIRQPLPIEEFSPAFAGAEQSFGVLMRYAKNKPGDEAKAFNALQLAAPAPFTAATRESAKWRDYVLKERARIETDWANLAPQRRWMDELAAFERIGDLTPSRIDADIMAVNVWRTLSQRACATATLQAIDGRGDEAIETLLPLLTVSRRLQISSRTLVRTMIAVVVERMTLETAALILDLAPVAPAGQARLLRALGDENAAPLARRLALIEYAVFAPTFTTVKFGHLVAVSGGAAGGAVRWALNSFSALFFLPNATINLYGERVYALAALAERRALGEFSMLSKGLDDSLRRAPGMKNIGGRLLLNLTIPAYQKVMDSHWTTTDLRVALRKRLTTAP